MMEQKIQTNNVVELAKPEPEQDNLKQGREVRFDILEPWPESVGSEIFSETAESLQRYLHLASERDALVLTFWTAHANCFEVFKMTPRLAITAPVKGCGKSTVLGIVQLMVNNSLSCDNMTPAAFFRLAETKKGMFAIDEVDSWFQRNSDLVSALNGGVVPQGSFIRCDTDNGNKPMQFSTHCAAAMCGINLERKLPGPLLDRCHVVNMEKALPGDMEIQFDHRKHTRIFIELGRKLSRFVTDNKCLISDCQPGMPEGIVGRKADIWEPLLSIAEAAGGYWPTKLKECLLSQPEIDDDSKGVQLLRDIRRIYDSRPWQDEENVHIGTLAIALGGLESADSDGYRPWARLHKGFEENDTRIKAADVSRLLKPYVGLPKPVRFKSSIDGKDVHRGYRWSDLIKAQERYGSCNNL